jgi:hypothetical protein
MVILIDEMISWLTAERARRSQHKERRQGQDIITSDHGRNHQAGRQDYLTLSYDDFEPSNKGGGHQQSSNNVTPMPPVGDGDIPF